MRRAILASLLAITIAAPAFAQDEVDGDKDEFVIVGSHVSRGGLASDHPVTFINGDDLRTAFTISPMPCERMHLAPPSCFEEEVYEEPEFVITGSLVPNSGSNADSPVTIVGGDEFCKTQDAHCRRLTGRSGNTNSCNGYSNVSVAWDLATRDLHAPQHTPCVSGGSASLIDNMRNR